MLQSSTQKAVEDYRKKAAEVVGAKMSKPRAASDSELNGNGNGNGNANLGDSMDDAKKVDAVGNLLETLDLCNQQAGRAARGRKRNIEGHAFQDSSAFKESKRLVSFHTRRSRSEEPRTNDKTEASWTVQPRVKRQKM